MTRKRHISPIVATFQALFSNLFSGMFGRIFCFVEAIDSRLPEYRARGNDSV